MASDDRIESPGTEADPQRAQSKTTRTPAKRRSGQTGPSRPDSEAAKGAGAAGIGGGTLLAIIASFLEEGLVKTIMIWLAPTASVALSAAWIWAQLQIRDYLAIKQAEADVSAAKVAIKEALRNESPTTPQKIEFERQLAELDQIIVQLRMSRATRHVTNN